MSRRRPTDIAIVGMACRFPGARDLFAYWSNILAGFDATTEIPPDRWDPAVFHDLESTANDRVACRRGGYLDAPITFDAASHGIMPNAVEGGEPEQFLVLDAAREALVDAGLGSGVPDGRRVEVVIGRGNDFNRGNLTRLQHGRIVAQTLAILDSLHPDWTEADREAVRADLKSSLPPFGPATVPGQLTNATAGRVANRLDLSGASYEVDAASASSLVALDLGAKALARGSSDLALVGGVYVEADVDFPLVFRQLGALSKSGRSRPFAKDADGMLSGEGVGVVVLKRRADAERDGDRVYAVLKGVGVSSEGRGVGLAAPSSRGHARAIRRAYRAAGVDPASVALIEGRGLGVPAADRAELRAIRSEFPPAPKGRRALGSVASMIGHAMPAAGIAGLIKAALALHHRVLPPTLHADDPHPLIEREDSPVTLNPTARPWVHGDSVVPRRAGVNAFGFAGINAHAVLEAHPSSDRDDASGALLDWETEAILLSADDRNELAGRLRSLLDWLASGPEVRLKDLAFSLNCEGAKACRIGFVVRSLGDLTARLEAALAKLGDPACRSIRDARGTYYWERPDGRAPRLAFLFPGEGSQYPGMMADLCPHFPEVRALFDASDRIAREAGAATWPSEHLFQSSPDQDPAIWSAEVGVNVVLSSQRGMYRLLSKLGLKADAVVGHSSGELLALAAGGVLEVDRNFEQKLGELGAIFGRLETSGDLPKARLVALAAPRSKVESALVGTEGVEVAMDNCPHQVVIAGDPVAVEEVVGRLKLDGVLCEDLPFDRAYHTPGFAPAIGPIAALFDALPMRSPRVPIYSCASEERMPDDPEAIRKLAVDQWTQAVGFRRTVEAMHADGIDVLVDVGARGNLAAFVEDTLRGRAAFAVAAHQPRRSGLTQLNHLVASLFARGVDLDARHLYARRRPQRVDFVRVPSKPTPPALVFGFPTMSLSEGLVERLRIRADVRGFGPSDPEPQAITAEGRSETTTRPEPSPNASDSRPDESLHWGLGPSLVPGTNGNGHHLALEMIEAPETDHVWDEEATLLGFQETMAEFLRTQQAVMEAFLLGSSGTSPEEVAFHLTGKTDEEMMPVGGPWAGPLVFYRAGQEAVSRLILDGTSDPVAEHHTLGGRRISAVHREWRGLPVLPFAVMAEMLAEAAARLMPGLSVLTLRDVKAHRWIRYEDEPVALELRASADPSSPNTVRVAIHNRGLAVAMKPLEAPVFEGAVDFGEARIPGPFASPLTLDHPVPCRFTPDSIYAEQWLFHGPALQAVVGIGPISMDGIEGTLRVLPFQPLLRESEDPSKILVDPIILDNFTHLLGGWGLDRLRDDGDVIFPLRMGELALFGESPAVGSDVACRVAIREVERHRVLVDADIVRPDGSTWMAIRGWEDWRFHWPGQFRDSFRQPDRAFLGERLGLPAAPDACAVWLEPPGDMGRPVWRDVLEQVQLGPDERAVYLALPGTDARRTHRLWGRIAAKEAARRLHLDRGGLPTYPADLLIEADAMGRPHLRERPGSSFGEAPLVSIAHVEGVAVALACLDPSSRPGIDVEPVVGRSATFEATAFLPGERALLGDRLGDDRAEWIARLWCAKEAVAKATGLGFVDGPSGVEVVLDNFDESLGVRLQGGLAEACPELADRVIRVVTARRGDFAWAWTLGEGVE